MSSAGRTVAGVKLCDIPKGRALLISALGLPFGIVKSCEPSFAVAQTFEFS